MTNRKATARRRRLEPLTNEESLALQESLGLHAGVRASDEVEQRRLVAFHEAGHAVAGCLLGRTLLTLSVDQHCEFEQPKNRSKRELENSIKVALSGPYAEAEASENSVCVGAGADIPLARQHAWKLAGDDWETRLQNCSIQAQHLVLESWTLIERVAARLQAGGVIRDEELKRLLK